MKLAQALVERKTLKDEIQNLRMRLMRVAKVQEGDKPAENPDELTKLLERKFVDLERHIVQINRSNVTAKLNDGRTLMEAIAERDILLLKRKVLDELVNSAMPDHSRFSRSEIRFVPTVNISELQKQSDQVSRRYRELDAEIQALNWEADLLE